MKSLASFVALLLLPTVAPCLAIELELDYTHDTFFGANPTAKATLEKAALDISNAITTTLGSTVDENSATAGITTITFRYDLSYFNPATGVLQPFDNVALPANKVKVFVGMQSLPGATLGAGSPGGTGFTGDPFTYNNFNDVATALHAAEAAANANIGRGGGPVLKHYSGSIPDIPNTSFTLSFGSTIGNLWFDNDTDNVNGVDSDATLNNYWQFDYNQPVGDRHDFYTVALHEMLHVLGVSTSENWDQRAQGQNWNGPQVISLLGTGTNVVSNNGDHLVDNLKSTRLSDGGVQDAVMSSLLTIGIRKTLTRLDLALLRDIGWDTIEYPLLPGDFNFDNVRTSADITAMLKALTNLEQFRTDRSLSLSQMLTLGNLNGDSAVTNQDLQSLLNLLATAGAGSVEAVPEPSSFLLLGCGVAGALVCRCRRKN